MNIGSIHPAHVTWLMSSAGGGIPPVVGGQVAALNAAGARARILGVLDPRAPSVVSPGLKSLSEDLFPAKGPIAFGWAPELSRELARGESNLAHLHGLFTWPSFAVRAFGSREGRPVVITPHGMLEPWALARSGWKKRLFRALIEDDNLGHAGCLQALNAAELASFRALGLANPVAVIPNGVDLPDESVRPHRDALERRYPAVRPGRRLLFLGRLHPKKGLVLLVEAWARLMRDGQPGAERWTLIIAGPDQLGHEAEVRKLVAERGLEGRVTFTGPLYGDAKSEALAAADAFVLPSHSEGFSMAVLEAMAWGLPVLVTPGCNFDVAALEAGLVAEATVPALKAALRQLMDASPAERAAMGLRGRAVVGRQYTWQSVAASLIEVYAWLLGGGSPPSSIEVVR